MTPLEAILLFALGAAILGVVVQSARVGRWKAAAELALEDAAKWKREVAEAHAELEADKLDLPSLAARWRNRLGVD